MAPPLRRLSAGQNLEEATHDTEEALATMVPDAYVNHIPVLTGGVGLDELREFYSKKFIPQMPPDTEMTPISRTEFRTRSSPTSRGSLNSKSSAGPR